MDDSRVAGIIRKYDNDPAQLVSVLQDVQAELYYLPKDALIQVSRTLNVPLSRVYAVATFFRAFSLKPRGKHLIHVCLGTACHVRGAESVLEKFERSLGVKRGGTTKDMKITLETVNCMGACALGPVVKVDAEYVGQMKIEKVEPLLKKYE